MKKVLVIDDQFGRQEDPLYRERYGRMSGYSFLLEDCQAGTVKTRLFGPEMTVKAYDAQKAVDRAAKEQPDAIILDLDFGIQQGYGFTILQRLQAMFPDIPVLISSSTDDDSLVQLCLDDGAKAFIGKLPQPEQMKEYLDRYAK